ncbi:MAG TPA: glycoside hydrolase family 3 N-terminal domain-containing protein, partial [Balneolales bacterium]|nr:glycoside hydrolase family 3 N-terminal domain-containing protein [Balneolales bacterium]
TAKLRNVMIKHHVGSFQNVISHAYSLKTWHRILDEIQAMNMKESRLKIPILYAIDGVHGANYTLGSTLFPQNIGLAATRDTLLAKKVAEITAKEVRATGIRYDFSPVLGVGRQPLWPRLDETFGEDVYLVKKMGLAEIAGYQGNDLKEVDHVAACMKHFIGYSDPTSGKDRTPALIPNITLREYYLPSFKAAIKAGAKTLMVNSGSVNGVPVHSSKYLLTDLLRKELGFQGVVISDWGDVKKLADRRRVASSYKEAVYQAITAGIDLCIVPNDLDFSKYLIELVKEKRIPESRIDESVRRILKLKYDVGLFDHPYVEKAAFKNFGRPEYKKIALKAARESMTLLKNDQHVLPLSKNKKIFVTGPGANSLTTLNGAWSYTWQGTNAKYFPKDEPTILKAIQEKAKNTSYKQGTAFVGTDKGIADAVAAAKNADDIVVCLGEDAYAETPGNIEDLELPENQQKLVIALSKLNKPIIAVFTEGRPRIIRKIEPLLSGILMAYWPGSQGGQAIADVLFGDYNPSGKLPITYPRNPNFLVTYDHTYSQEGVETANPQHYSEQFNPQFAFGYGLSYTTYKYGDIMVSSDTLTANAPMKISVNVTNSGKMAGKETVELYSSDLIASVTPSVKRLRKFAKIYLKSGETREVSFTLTAKDLAFVGRDLKWVTEPGAFDIRIGNRKKRIVYVSQ